MAVYLRVSGSVGRPTLFQNSTHSAHRNVGHVGRPHRRAQPGRLHAECPGSFSSPTLLRLRRFISSSSHSASLPYDEHEVRSIPEQEVIAPLFYFGDLLPALCPVSTVMVQRTSDSISKECRQESYYFRANIQLFPHQPPFIVGSI
jgi:hypothetical protein